MAGEAVVLNDEKLEHCYGQSLLRRSNAPCKAGAAVLLRTQGSDWWVDPPETANCHLANCPTNLLFPPASSFPHVLDLSRKRKAGRSRLSNTGVPWVCVWTPNSLVVRPSRSFGNLVQYRQGQDEKTGTTSFHIEWRSPFVHDAPVRG